MTNTNDNLSTETNQTLPADNSSQSESTLSNEEIKDSTNAKFNEETNAMTEKGTNTVVEIAAKNENPEVVKSGNQKTVNGKAGEEVKEAAASDAVSGETQKKTIASIEAQVAAAFQKQLENMELPQKATDAKKALQSKVLKDKKNILIAVLIIIILAFAFITYQYNAVGRVKAEQAATQFAEVEIEQLLYGDIYPYSVSVTQLERKGNRYLLQINYDWKISSELLNAEKEGAGTYIALVENNKVIRTTKEYEVGHSFDLESIKRHWNF